jgi:hypothetical protein
MSRKPKPVHRRGADVDMTPMVDVLDAGATAGMANIQIKQFDHL